MPTITEILANVNDATKRRNPDLFPSEGAPIHTPQGAQHQRAVPDRAMGQEKGKGGYTGRVQIRVDSVRSRLIDPDNLCPKYFIDALRYAGVIKDDSAKDIEYTITQRKKARLEEEHTIIELIPIT